ncbi:hypothetical protein O3G_MSEX012373 [Manduca sexta]|uniref:Decapping nuclease n=1 Tax=Manduca sexta TaxID=7130 RepID=A0A921ZPI1_MANSE|nr:hypothetical protein O3G_MSEX012373 [Manduca sexta]
MDMQEVRHPNPRNQRNNREVCPHFPKIVGYMSVDKERESHSDLSQLKFVTTIPQGRAHMDLNYNLDNSVKCPIDNNEKKIDLVLKYLIEHKDQYDELQKTELTIITHRHTLINIMCTAFKFSHPIRVMACFYKKCIYIWSMDTSQDFDHRIFRSDQTEKSRDWDYKFEQYMSSDLPNTFPDLHKPVIENEEFSLYIKSQVADHNLFYRAQIDGMLATNKKIPEPPNTNDFETNMKYISDNNNFVDLKSTKQVTSRRIEEDFRNLKLLKCWCRCYLTNLSVVIGFRDDAGTVVSLKWLAVDEMAECLKLGWDPQRAVTYLGNFITFIKKTFTDHMRSKSTPETSGPISMQFDTEFGKRMTVTRNSNSDNNILPEWYLEAMNQ